MEYGLTLMAVDPPEPFLDMVRFADESAYDFMWVCDSSLHDRYVYCYLTLLATNSKNLLFGPNCTHPHTRHPAMNFNALCTLYKLSGGRTVMNLGAGDRPVMELGFKMARSFPTSWWTNSRFPALRTIASSGSTRSRPSASPISSCSPSVKTDTRRRGGSHKKSSPNCINEKPFENPPGGPTILRLADMAWGARRAVVDCAGTKPGEQVLIVTDSMFDERVVEVFAAIAAEAGAVVTMTTMTPAKIPGEPPPRTVAAAMKEADIILELTSQFIGSSDARVQACKNGARHLILVEMSPYLLRRGGPFEADFDKLKPIAEDLQDRFTKANTVHLTTRAGTDITASLEGRTGRHHAGLAREPGVLAAPPDVEAGIGPPEGTMNGLLVIDGLIELLGLGVITEPFEVEVKDGRCVRIEGKGDGRRHATALKNTLDSLDDPNAFVIAEIAIGLNPYADYCQEALECEAVLGSAHIGVGDNRGYGGTNASKGHFDLVMRDATASLDGEVILENGDLTTTSIRALMG